jgi:Helix-hairpin-helix domain
MATKTTLQSVLGRHTEVLAEFRKRLTEVQREKGVPSDLVVREKTRLLTAVEGRIEAARSDRDATVERLDAGIAALEQRAAALKAEIDADRGALDPRGGGMPFPPAGKPPRPVVGAPTGKAPTQRGAKRTAKAALTAIQGVGKAYSDRLQAAGVHTPAGLAKMKPAEVAEALSISEERAKALVAAAKKVK